ncbi:MAG: voltage-gated potassium channel [Actinomycetota bacterium]|jgi:voltage-gated potassium channel|nr:voltage-gated potassium channel [Actinomycetota bacterium]
MEPVTEASWKLRMPRGQSVSPTLAIARRVAIAVVIVLLNWGLVVLERDGYRDAVDGKLSIIDALYYTTVTLSTTGYGDITPVTTSARLINALLVTPMRFLFVLVLVGTTIQVLTERSRDQFRVARWRSRVNQHVIVCGYGTKGRSAVRALLQRGVDRDEIVVVETDHEAIEAASADGLATVHGTSTSDAVLKEAEVDRARAVIIAVDRDDAAVLTTLTVRQFAPNANVVAAVREAENADLLTQSGADSVITSSDAAGRLLGLATDSPATVEVVEDLIAHGRGLDLLEREVRQEDVGSAAQALGVPVLAVVRGGETLPYDDPAATSLQAGDRLIYVQGRHER